MAITTLDGIVGGAQPAKYFHKSAVPGFAGSLGKACSTWYAPGIPGPGVADTSTANGNVRSSSSALVPGQLPFYDPGSGTSYLARLTAALSVAGLVQICDRLWDCGANSSGSAFSPTSTSTQTVNSATWPARDESGNTVGEGVLIGLEVSSTLGAGNPTITISYTNPGGTTGRTGISPAVSNSSSVGTLYQFSWQSGDYGVKSVQSVGATISQTSGQWGLIAYRVLAALEIPNASVGNSGDPLTLCSQNMLNGCVPFIVVWPSGTAGFNVLGAMTVSQG